MRFKSLVLASILLAALAYAKEPKAYQSGKLVQMNAEQCGVEAKDTKNSTDDSGVSSGHGQTQELLCGEYLLQADEVVYRIRPKNAKHAVLVPIGEWAQFRLEKDKMLLRAPHFDGKEREYIVVSMTPRGESSADAHPVRLNHLQ
jgi:hypothetical protein